LGGRGTGHLEGEDDELALLGLLHAGCAVGLKARVGRKGDLLLPRVLPILHGAVSEPVLYGYSSMPQRARDRDRRPGWGPGYGGVASAALNLFSLLEE
jgi:hypothetical protein